MQLALHKCTLVPKRRRRVEASAELLQGLPEPLESAAWLTAHPHSLYNLVTGPNGGPWGARRGALPGGGACTVAPSRDPAESWVPW